jgi:hypothetical protein
MPTNVLPKDTPRGRGPEPKQAFGEKQEELLAEGEEALKEKESDLADLETQALWESQEIGNTSWSGAGGTRYSDPD